MWGRIKDWILSRPWRRKRIHLWKSRSSFIIVRRVSTLECVSLLFTFFRLCYPRSPYILKMRNRGYWYFGSLKTKKCFLIITIDSDGEKGRRLHTRMVWEEGRGLGLGVLFLMAERISWGSVPFLSERGAKYKLKSALIWVNRWRMKEYPGYLTLTLTVGDFQRLHFSNFGWREVVWLYGEDRGG